MFLQGWVQPTMSARLRCASNNSRNGVGGGLMGKNVNFTFLIGGDVDLWCYCMIGISGIQYTIKHVSFILTKVPFILTVLLLWFASWISIRGSVEWISQALAIFLHNANYVVSNDLNLLYFKQYLPKDQTQVLEHFEPPSLPNNTDNDALACKASIFAPLGRKYT